MKLDTLKNIAKQALVKVEGFDPQAKCYDCGSNIRGHHTPLCGLASASSARDLPQIAGTQHWNGLLRVGSYMMHPLLAARIPDPQMLRTMTTNEKYSIGAESPCGKECQALFDAFNTLASTGASAQARTAASRLLRVKLSAENELPDMTAGANGELARCVMQVAAIYMFG